MKNPGFLSDFWWIFSEKSDKNPGFFISPPFLPNAEQWVPTSVEEIRPWDSRELEPRTRIEHHSGSGLSGGSRCEAILPGSSDDGEQIHLRKIYNMHMSSRYVIPPCSTCRPTKKKS